MPGYQAHITAGAIVAASTWTIISLYSPAQAPRPLLGTTLCAVVILSSLFPDIDTDSKGQNLFYGGMVLIDIGLFYKKLYQWSAILGFVAMLPALGHHRCWTHTWWAMLVVPLPVFLLPKFFWDISWQQVFPFYIAVVLGYASHLLLDKFWSNRPHIKKGPLLK